MVVKIVDARRNLQVPILKALLQGTFLGLLVYSALLYYLLPTYLDVLDWFTLFLLSLFTVFLHEFAHIRAAKNLFGDKICKILIKASIFSVKIIPFMKKGQIVDSSLKKYGLMAGPVVPIAFLGIPLGILALLGNELIKHLALLNLGNVLLLTLFSIIPFSFMGYTSDTKRIIEEYKKEQGEKRLGVKQWLYLIYDSFFVTLRKNHTIRRDFE